ncbi:C-type lectin-like [Centropristis striata]|uniref:C-type lectin-like n=1 Tax=Centropristis striata TaxID=184440 RepID=UPI0027E1F74E|nr:C-type lectin-like [Centropristis striata]
MIESAENKTNVQSAIPFAVNAWIGLYRVPGSWSDNSDSLFRNWISGEPNNAFGRQQCVTENANHEWDDTACSNLYPFLCHQDPILKKSMLRMKIKTDADLTDPATNSQILQQLSAVFASLGWTDVKLRWEIQCRKPEKEKLAEPHCIIQF